MPVDISICIVNFRTPNLVLDCVESIFNKTHKINFEVIIVDNNSQDNSINIFKRRLIKRGICLVQNNKNRGYAAACNLGLSQARGRYFVLLNSDTRLQNNVFFHLVKFGDSHPECAVLSPALYNPDLSPQKSFSYFKTPYQRAMWELVDPFTKLGLMTKQDFHRVVLPRRPVLVERPRGVCFCIKAQSYYELGPLDERFFMYCEEVDFSLRSIRAGFKNYFIPQAKLTHLGGASSINPQLKKVHQLSDYLYYSKHYGLPAQLLIRLSTLFSGLLYLLLSLKREFRFNVNLFLYQFLNACLTSRSINWKQLY